MIKKDRDYSDLPADWLTNDNHKIEDLPIKEVARDVVTMDRFPWFWLENEEFGYEGEDLQSPEEYEIIGHIHQSIHDTKEKVE